MKREFCSRSKKGSEKDKEGVTVRTKEGLERDKERVRIEGRGRSWIIMFGVD